MDEIAIIRCLQNHPGATIREIVAEVGGYSPSDVWRVVLRLKGEGVVTGEENRARTLQVAEGVFVDSRGTIWKHWEPK